MLETSSCLADDADEVIPDINAFIRIRPSDRHDFVMAGRVVLVDGTRAARRSTPCICMYAHVHVRVCTQRDFVPLDAHGRHDSPCDLSISERKIIIIALNVEFIPS